MQEDYSNEIQFEDTDEAFEERRRIRAERMAERKRIRKRKQKIYRMTMTAVILLAAIIGFGTVIVKGIHRLRAGDGRENEGQTISDDSAYSGADEAAAGSAAYGQMQQAGQAVMTDGVQQNGHSEDLQNAAGNETVSDGTDSAVQDKAAAGGKGAYSFTEAEAFGTIPEEVVSTGLVFIDREKGEIIAGRDVKTRMNPASMTKILTVLVAAEHVDNLDDTFTITREITDYGYINDCSAAGFLEDETVTVRDLFYGTILPSGADAGVGLAIYVAGSQEAFVGMMNEKLEELGISDTTHFTNCVGIYDSNHYSTPYDMAVILQAALDNELCREVMSAHTYTTSVTEQHPEGIVISNWFLRRIEDKDTGGEVICAKTGYVVESGSCAASYGRSNSGKEYLCVTAGSTSSWRCIYDHVALYKQFSDQSG